MPTPAKLGLRARYKKLEEFNNRLRVNSENATIVANAMFWKLGLKNREEIKAVVDEYMTHMTDKIAKLKETSSLQVMDKFIDPAILQKVAEHADSAETDSEDSE
jgi:hypothetical protein